MTRSLVNGQRRKPLAELRGVSQDRCLSVAPLGRARVNRDSISARLRALANVFGPTPVIELEHPTLNLFASLQFCNPAGSVKDRPAYWILDQAFHRGDLDSRATVIESSSGNFAVALAMFCRFLGLPFVPVIDPNIASSNERVLHGLCERVEKISSAEAQGGYLAARLQRISELRAEPGHVFWTNQYANEDAVSAHYRFTGTEICRAVPSIDFLFVAVSTCGTIAGVSQRVREQCPRVQVVAVDAEGSVIFGGRAGRRRIPGIGASVVPGLLSDTAVDRVMKVTEQETVLACRRLLREHGLFAGGSSGSVFSAINRFGTEIASNRKPNVLFVCADRGTAYLDTVFSDDWARTQLGLRALSPEV